MKLIVQIPCYNEEGTLAQTVRDIPRVIEGVDSVELLIVDDGSRDRTIEVAQECGVDHIVQHRHNSGLARAFRSGLEACLAQGADIIVNTDGDNQYPGPDIPKLIRPILDGDADIVIGDRQTSKIAHFSWLKKQLQRFGSAYVRQLSGVQVPDAVSGFRALSREAALRINIVSSFSYTIEMLIQAGNKKLAVASVPVATNPKVRESRLFRSIPYFLARSFETIVRMYAMYRPLKVFSVISLGFLVLGAVPVLRFLYFYFSAGGAGHVQSLILGGVLIVMGFVALLIGLVADLINFNRRLIETTLVKVSRIELELRAAHSDEPRRTGSNHLDTETVRRELKRAGQDGA